MRHFLTYFNMISTILLKLLFVSYDEGPIKTHDVWRRYRVFEAKGEVLFKPSQLCLKENFALLLVLQYVELNLPNKIG